MKQAQFWENFIIVAIILVIIQTFMHEYAIYAHWGIFARHVILIFGFCFDLIFSIEFLIRSVITSKKGSLKDYWFYERGWVDFLSSLPLLLLDSGPTMYLLAMGGLHDGSSATDVVNVLKVVKAVRVTRILRLVRIIKIFGKIQNTESKMTQHHTTTIATTAVFTIVCALLAFSFIDGSGKKEVALRACIYKNYLITIENYDKDRDDQKELAMGFFSGDPFVIKLTYDEKSIIANITEKDFHEKYSMDDCITVESNGLRLFLSIVDIHRRVALNHMESFFIIVMVVLSFMILYTRHFAQNVSDIIHILNKGLRKKNYNLQVKVKKQYADEEIFRLVDFYNNAYLPAKLRHIQEEEKEKGSSIAMDDFMGYNK